MLLKKSIFSFEGGEEKTAIDRVLDKSEATDGKPFSLTSKVLEQRDAMVKEAQEEAEELEKEEDENSDDSGDSGDDDSSDGEGGDDWDDDDESGEGEGSDDDGDDWDDPADEDDSDDSDDSDDEDGDDDEDDSDDNEDDESDDEKDKGDKDDKNDDKKDEKEEAAASWESHQETLRTISNEDITPNVDFTKRRRWDFFKPLRDAEIGRREVLASFGFGFEDSEGNQPSDDVKDVYSGDSEKNIAFTKDAIVKSISNLGEINKKYYDNTVLFIEKLTKSIPKLDQRLLNFQRVYERGEVEFTNKMISDVSILSHIAYGTEINLREVLKINKNYSKDSNDIAKMILNTKFDQIEDVFLNKNFMPKGDILEYKKKLPGFNLVLVSLPEFKNYLKTSPLEYQYYTVKENNPSDTYEIRPVSITEEKDVEYFLTVMKSIIIDLSVSVDILRTLLNEFKKFMDSLKILRVGVEEDEFEKLSELGLDEKVQQFILFKLIVEIISTNINLTIESLSGFMEVMDNALKLVDIEPEVEVSDSSDSGSDWSSDDSEDDSEDSDDEGDDDDWGDDDW